jgi:hypothetical protein
MSNEHSELEPTGAVAASVTEIPRRADMRRWCAAERAIYDAMQAVESMPADIRLTAAVTKLGEAFNSVADFVDSQPRECPHGGTIGACSWCDLRDDGGLPEAARE